MSKNVANADISCFISNHISEYNKVMVIKVSEAWHNDVLRVAIRYKLNATRYYS